MRLDKIQQKPLGVLMANESAVDTKILVGLRRGEKELKDYYAAIQELGDKHYDMMSKAQIGLPYALGWLGYESDFGDALMRAMTARESR